MVKKNKKDKHPNGTPTFDLLTPQDNVSSPISDSLDSDCDIKEDKSSDSGYDIKEDDTNTDDVNTDHSIDEEEDDESDQKSDDSSKTYRIVTRCSPSSIIALAKELKRNNKKLDMLEVVGMKHILGIKLNRLPIQFVNWIWGSFDPTECCLKLDSCRKLLITEEDVSRVYNLPRGKKIIDLQSCPELCCVALKKELKLTGRDNTVNTNVLYANLSSYKNLRTWTKAAILYIIGTLLCAKSNFTVSLQYAEVLSDVESINKYNWCKHVLQQIQKNKKSANGDLHFLMVNYLDHVEGKVKAKKCAYNVPTCSKWDIKPSYEKLGAIGKWVRFGCAISNGVTFVDPNHDEMNLNRIPTVLPFDVDRCPTEKVNEYMGYCRGQINLFEDCLKKLLKRKGGDEDDIPVEKKKEEMKATNKAEKTTAMDEDRIKRKQQLSQDEPDGKRKRTKNQTITERKQHLLDQSLHFVPFVEKEVENKKDFMPHLDDDINFTTSDFEQIDSVINSIQKSHLGEGSKCNEMPMDENSIQKSHLGEGSKCNEVPMDVNSIQKSHLGEGSKCNQMPMDEVYLAEGSKSKEIPLDDIVYSPSELAKIDLEVNLKIMDSEKLREQNETMIGEEKEKTMIGEEKQQENKQKIKKKEIQNLQEGEAVLGQRERTVSKYLKSPYEKHVQNYNIPVAGKKLLAYAWAKDLLTEEPLFQCRSLRVPELCRDEFLTLNRGQPVSSLIIDNFVHYMHLKESDGDGNGIKRLCTTITASWKDVNDEERGVIDNRGSKKFAADFLKKLDVCKKVTHNKIDFKNIEVIFMPCCIDDHYVVFTVNFMNQRFEYLNSIPSRRRLHKNGRPTKIGAVGERLTSEASAFVMHYYTSKQQDCPYQFDTWKWEDPEMPEQADGSSCGIFVMKFIEEWQGYSTPMPSFKNWKKMGESKRLENTTTMRMYLCNLLLQNPHNEKFATVLKNATKFIEEKNSDKKKGANKKDPTKPKSKNN